MVDIDGLAQFIAKIPGDRAEIKKDVLVRIERDLREGAAAKAMLRASGAIGDVCSAIAGGGQSAAA